MNKRGVGGQGYGLSEQIDRKVDLLLKRLDQPIVQSPQTPHSPIGEVNNSLDVEEEENIVITYDEEIALHQDLINKPFQERKQEQRKKRKDGNDFLEAFITAQSIHCRPLGNTQQK